jgi:hypothetical protein
VTAVTVITKNIIAFGALMFAYIDFEARSAAIMRVIWILMRRTIIEITAFDAAISAFV